MQTQSPSLTVVSPETIEQIELMGDALFTQAARLPGVRNGAPTGIRNNNFVRLIETNPGDNFNPRAILWAGDPDLRFEIEDYRNEPSRNGRRGLALSRLTQTQLVVVQPSNGGEVNENPSIGPSGILENLTETRQLDDGQTRAVALMILRGLEDHINKSLALFGIN